MGRELYTDGDETRASPEEKATYRTTFDWAEDVPSMVVVTAVATVTGTDATALPPLNDSIDPDALNALFESRHDGQSRRGGAVSFRFAGCRVTLYGDGELVARTDTTGHVEKERFESGHY